MYHYYRPTVDGEWTEIPSESEFLAYPWMFQKCPYPKPAFINSLCDSVEPHQEADTTLGSRSSHPVGIKTLSRYSELNDHIVTMGGFHEALRFIVS